jgi:DNA repair photolyase
MKTVISASRRTDLVSFYYEWLAEALRQEEARFFHHGLRSVVRVNLSPAEVHTLVLWSKNYETLLENRSDLRKLLKKYDQIYFHFTITGLGGTFLEKLAPPPEVALKQLPDLLEIAGRPERISIRFDPIVFWLERGKLKTNFDFFQVLAEALGKLQLRTVRFSFTQWYKKALTRAGKAGLIFFEPSFEEKKELVSRLVEIARKHNLELLSCSQKEIASLPGIKASACIDGSLLKELHPRKETASILKDHTQRPDCLCTESIDIGSYTQSCPTACLYCYANPKIKVAQDKKSFLSRTDV